MLSFSVLNDASERRECLLLVDDQLLEIPGLTASLTSNDLLSIDYYGKELDALQALSKISTSELVSKIFEMGLLMPLPIKKDFPGFVITYIGFTPQDRKPNYFEFTMSSEFYIVDWDAGWSMWEHSRLFKEFLESNSIPLSEKSILFNTYPVEMGDLTGQVPELNSFELKISREAKDDCCLFDLVDECLNILECGLDYVTESLGNQEKHSEIHQEFSFPEPVKASCNQYLMYFTQFLSDLGIEATVDLNDGPSGVLFSVTPCNKQEALENIRVALDVFLKLPSAPVQLQPFPSSSQHSIEIQRLISNIQHFQGQLTLANAVIQQKELTIQQQGSLIQQQGAFIQQQNYSGSILTESLRESSDTSDAEPVLGGLAKIKPVKVLNEGLEVDAPRIFRLLRDFFSKK